ncbi:filamentation induced by cAMP protein Fic [Caballeronia choica]|jgi:Fic family protein|uniref:Filamentation induced by cAMP protein Fic n=1 Tax=Caballeronia choica TaxID=326476 RepID=A0A158L1W4_9BURK|nr:Fic family protein [Caballeronia choica]SAL87009.1 filamentation induced by cAMP protein Fic [Caballeronia choica]
MAASNEKLAASLKILKELQDHGSRVFRPSAMPSLTRIHRERLVRAGFLKQVIQGWYLANNPADADGDSTHWYANMEIFVAAYANSRFDDGWQLSAELSILKHSGHTSIAKQLQLQSPKANNQMQELPHGCSLFIYRISESKLVASRAPDASGLRLMPMPDALIRVSPTFFTQHEMAAQIAMRQVDISLLIARLLEGGNSLVAGRLAGALRAVGRAADANQLLATMKAAMHTTMENNPFERPLAQITGRRNESPYVLRIKAMWAAMRETVLKRFNTVPRRELTDADGLLLDITARYVADAYHSLSIEGYRVSTELIEKVRNGQWSPLTHPKDGQTRDAMAAKGYAETHSHVKALIGRVVKEGLNPAKVFSADFFQWYVALFSPSVQAGILKAGDLAGFRNNQVFIRNALHVPPSPEAVRDCMPALMDLLESEDHPGVRAVLGHFIFVFIHPYMDGNGRLSRFVMNFMLTTGGYPWTIVTVQSRKAYLDALEQASTFGNIEPFAELLCSLISEQAATPVERITQRPEAGDWTAPPV